MVSTWTFEDFKTAVLGDLGLPQISEINLEVLTLTPVDSHVNMPLVNCIYGGQ